MKLFTCLLVLLLIGSCDLIKSTQLEGAVVKALGADERTASYSFEVSHQGDGQVLITGEVMNGDVVAAVGEVAGAVEGVTSVTNRCSVPDSGGGGLMQDTVVVTPYL